MVNLVFDYDGTLHQSIKIYAPAFRKAAQYLAEKKLVKSREYPEGEIAQWLGYNAKEMWNRFAPHLPQKEKETCSGIIGDEMLRLIYAGKAVLYPCAAEVLFTLKQQGFTLLFLSNCKTAYMDAHTEAFGLGRFFSGFYCSQQFGFIPKYKIFKQLQKEWPGRFVVVGDRFQDMEIAEKNGLKSVGCLYGYGRPEELKNATFHIESIEEILPLAGML